MRQKRKEEDEKKNPHSHSHFQLQLQLRPERYIYPSKEKANDDSPKNPKLLCAPFFFLPSPSSPFPGSSNASMSEFLAAVVEASASPSPSPWSNYIPLACASRLVSFSCFATNHRRSVVVLTILTGQPPQDPLPRFRWPCVLRRATAPRCPCSCSSSASHTSTQRVGPLRLDAAPTGSKPGSVANS